MPKSEHTGTSHFSYAVCTSRGVQRTPHLQHFTKAEKHGSTYGLNLAWQFNKADLIVDWGSKRQSKLSHIAGEKEIPVLSLEDGFIRSLGLGIKKSRSFSIISDWSGIYYDATRASDLENILQGLDPRSQEIPSLINRALKAIHQICEQEISKYNHATRINLGEKTKRRILLVDQTVGDFSISTGLASGQSFENMLADAIEESKKADIEILIKTHPDVIAGKKRAYLGKRNYPPYIRLISEDCNPISLLKQVDEVRVVTSQMGFEACLLGLPVTCYGVPFYSGWGITIDKQSVSRRTKERTIEEIFSAAYLLYPTYFNPETGALSDIEAVISHITRQKNYWQQNHGHLICIGFDRWKHSYVRHFLKGLNNEIEFTSKLDPAQLKPQSRIIVWGNNISDSDKALAKKKNISIETMEDGFIRSVQLGKYGVAPRSLVLDSLGIYFDPSQSSDLESILQNEVFSEEDENQANVIRQILIEQKISKYNIGTRHSLNIRSKIKHKAQKIILVPGQVNSDVSILKGCHDINTNAALLKAVREANPDAYILYKPHPDVVSGNIIETQSDYGKFADQIETRANIHLCLEQADEVHTMTSLVGFEALLQNKTVYCYGSPFYSGWGLTIDMPPDSRGPKADRRTRKLTLHQLISGTLVKYPRYIDLETGEFVSANQVLSTLGQEIKEGKIRILKDNLIYRWGLKIRHGGLGMLRNWLNI